MTNYSSIKNRIKRAGFFVPFTVYFVVFAAIAIFCGSLLSNQQIKADSSFADVFTLLVKVAAWFSITIVGVSLLLVLVSFVHFFYHKRKNDVTVKIETDNKENDLHQKQTVELFIKPIVKPLFGFIKLRLLYDETHFSHKFSLLEHSKRSLFSTTLQGQYHWPLPEIREYKVEKAIIYFEDVFQFFSIAVEVPAQSRFFTQPSSRTFSDLSVYPRKTEDTTIRIDQLRKVEGEFLNYKSFEDNDDVRRIVWKIYAKNKELVVRTPERMDPYASHAYLYSSFYSSIDVFGNDVAEIPFLNYFKIMTWSVYQNLVKQGFDVRYVPDQDVAKNNQSDQQQWVKYCISTSKWHQDTDLKTFVKTNDASIVIVSSFTDAAQLGELVESHGRDISFIFVKLTDSFKHQNIIDWVQWLLVKDEQQDMDLFKRKWALSPLRLKIRDNEKRLEEILSKADKYVAT